MSLLLIFVLHLICMIRVSFDNRYRHMLLLSLLMLSKMKSTLYLIGWTWLSASGYCCIDQQWSLCSDILLDGWHHHRLVIRLMAMYRHVGATFFSLGQCPQLLRDQNILFCLTCFVSTVDLTTTFYIGNNRCRANFSFVKLLLRQVWVILWETLNQSFLFNIIKLFWRYWKCLTSIYWNEELTSVWWIQASSTL